MIKVYLNDLFNCICNGFEKYSFKPNLEVNYFKKKKDKKRKIYIWKHMPNKKEKRKKKLRNYSQNTWKHKIEVDDHMCIWPSAPTTIVWKKQGGVGKEKNDWSLHPFVFFFFYQIKYFIISVEPNQALSLNPSSRSRSALRDLESQYGFSLDSKLFG